jgi:hypothetical protein
LEYVLSITATWLLGLPPAFIYDTFFLTGDRYYFVSYTVIIAYNLKMDINIFYARDLFTRDCDGNNARKGNLSVLATRGIRQKESVCRKGDE